MTAKEEDQLYQELQGLDRDAAITWCALRGFKVQEYHRPCDNFYMCRPRFSIPRADRPIKLLFRNRKFVDLTQ